MSEYVPYGQLAIDKRQAEQNELFNALTRQYMQNVASRQQQQAQQQHDLLKQQAEYGLKTQYEAPILAETVRHNQAGEGISKQQADTMERYRRDQAEQMREKEKVDKLKLLLGGGVGGATTAEGKPLSMEAQKVSNLVDAGRSALNRTEQLAKENPITAAVQAGTPQFLANPLAKFLGGKFKEINDSVGMTREAMQNVKTGAAATGQQAASFQNWSQPGVLDILRGNIGEGSNQLREDMNLMQQGFQKQARTVSPQMLEAAGLQNDPIAKQALQQQETAIQQRQSQIINKMEPADQELYKDILAQPGHPNVRPAKQMLERKYGKLF